MENPRVDLNRILTDISKLCEDHGIKSEDLIEDLLVMISKEIVDCRLDRNDEVVEFLIEHQKEAEKDESLMDALLNDIGMGSK